MYLYLFAYRNDLVITAVTADLSFRNQSVATLEINRPERWFAAAKEEELDYKLN